MLKDFWTPVTNEVGVGLCPGSDNPHNPYAVAVRKESLVVGHIPRNISTVCSLFLWTELLQLLQGTDISIPVTYSRMDSKFLGCWVGE